MDPRTKRKNYFKTKEVDRYKDQRLEVINILSAAKWYEVVKKTFFDIYLSP